jgi:uncharacterized iron-regulated protein
VSVLWLALACGPVRAPSAPPPPAAEAPVAEENDSPPEVPEDVVERAAGPVRVVRLSDGEELSTSALARELLDYDAICAGEEHTSAAQHYGELWLLERLSAQAPYMGLELGVGFEMWPAKVQGVVSAYAESKISEKRLLKQTEYEKTWGYDFAYYRPIVTRARELSLPLLALNASPTMVEKIRKDGLSALDEWTSRSLPELDLSDAAHRKDFERRMKKHPGVEASNLDNYYAALVLWDETMADNTARWLDLHAPVRRLLVIAGQAHCQRSAIPKRTVRRGAKKVAALLLATQKPEPSAAASFDYAVIVDSDAD